MSLENAVLAQQPAQTTRNGIQDAASVHMNQIYHALATLNVALGSAHKPAGDESDDRETYGVFGLRNYLRISWVVRMDDRAVRATRL